MSLSDGFSPYNASAWYLDELEVPDVFMPIDMSTPIGEHAEQSDPEPRLDNAAFEAAVAARVAEMKARIEKDAYARGHAAGVEESHTAAADQISRVLQALIDATSLVQAHEQRWLGNIEENLAASAVSIARHLIQRELTMEPSVVTDLVTRSLQQFPMERQITVRLHPDDLAIVQEVISQHALVGTEKRAIHWFADPHIVRGGCLVDGRERVLDGRIDTALERAYRALGQVQS